MLTEEYTSAPLYTSGTLPAHLRFIALCNIGTFDARDRLLFMLI